jgi:hypothetical protein
MPLRATITSFDSIPNLPNVTVVHVDGHFGSDSMNIKLSYDEFEKGYDKWKGGELIQNAFPTLSAVEREFLMTGMNEGQQKRVFG